MKSLKHTNYTKPFTDIKSVILFFHGKYPHISTPLKDITFPQRIFPNAKFYIRCNTRDEGTRLYFHEVYKGFKYELVDEKLDVLNLDVDAIFAKQERFAYFGGVMEKFCVDYNRMLNIFRGKIYILYNDEFLRPFDTLDNEYKTRPETWFKRNAKQLASIPPRSFDYSNVTILANDNRISNWVTDDNLISQYAIDNNINLMYLTDRVLYDIPTTVPNVKYPQKFNIIPYRGIFISLFFNKRITTWNKIMCDENLSLEVFGPGTNNLKYYAPPEEIRIDNSKIGEYYQHAHYSLYMGKGTESRYLGATFFVPILNGCPLFIWEGTDPNRKIFPNINCYYKNDKDLSELLNKINLKEIYEAQLNSLMNDY